MVTNLDYPQCIKGSYDETAQGLVTISKRGSLTDASGNATASSAQVVAADANRNYFMIQNLDGATAIYVNFGAVATAGSGSFKIVAGGSLTFEGNFICSQAINVIAASGTVAFTAKAG